MDNFIKLQKRFHLLKDAYLKQAGKISIDTLDNPGWIIEIDLNLKLDTKKTLIKEGVGKGDEYNEWISCWIEHGRFNGVGGPFYLKSILDVFFSLDKGNYLKCGELKKLDRSFNENCDFNYVEKIQSWYFKMCDKNWEHQYGISIFIDEKLTWNVEIALVGYKSEMIIVDTIQSEKSWFKCWVEKEMFYGKGGIENLTDILKVFIELDEKENFYDIRERIKVQK